MANSTNNSKSSSESNDEKFVSDQKNIKSRIRNIICNESFQKTENVKEIMCNDLCRVIYHIENELCKELDLFRKRWQLHVTDSDNKLQILNNVIVLVNDFFKNMELKTLTKTSETNCEIIDEVKVQNVIMPETVTSQSNDTDKQINQNSIGMKEEKKQTFLKSISLNTEELNEVVVLINKDENTNFIFKDNILNQSTTSIKTLVKCEEERNHKIIQSTTNLSNSSSQNSNTMNESNPKSRECTFNKSRQRVNENINSVSRDIKTKKLETLKNFTKKISDHDINTFWNQIKTCRVQFVDNEELKLYLQSLVILIFTQRYKEEFYYFTVFCALHLRHPNEPENLLITNEKSVENNQVETLKKPYIDYLNILTVNRKINLQLTDEEINFINQVIRLNSTLLSIWGPAFASILIRLSDTKAEVVFLRLQRLNQKLAESYGLNMEDLPLIPQNYNFLEHLKYYSNFMWKHPENINTLYKGAIEIYESSRASEQTKQILNFLILKNLRYRHMHLLIAIDYIRKFSKIRLSKLIEKTTFHSTKTSWIQYFSFIKNKMYIRDKKWKYCSNFDSNLFSHVSFDQNVTLCSILFVTLVMYMKKRRKAQLLYQKLIKIVNPNHNSADFFITFIKNINNFLNEMSETSHNL